MKIRIISAIIMLSLCVMPVQADDIGLIKSVTGDVIVQRQAEEFKAHSGMHIAKSDKLITKPDSSAGIIFTDGTTLALGEDTEFVVSDYLFEPDQEEYAFSLYLEKGAAIYNSGKIGKLSPDSVSLTTPRATISIRGTRLIINVK